MTNAEQSWGSHGLLKSTAHAQHAAAASSSRWMAMAGAWTEVREGDHGVEGMWRRVNEGVKSPSGCPNRQMEQQQRCSNGGARSGAWRPRRHFIEHVARVGVGKVGGDFGLVSG